LFFSSTVSIFPFAPSFIILIFPSPSLYFKSPSHVPFYFVGLLINQLYLISLCVTIISFFMYYKSDYHVRALSSILSCFLFGVLLAIVHWSCGGRVHRAPPFLVDLVYHIDFYIFFWHNVRGNMII
jgi:hypothetical protein